MATNYATQVGERKNSLLYTSGDYGYIKDCFRNETLYLECRHSKHKKCKGTAKIIADILTPGKEHTCNSSSIDLKVIAARAELKEKAETQNVGMRSLFDTYCRDIEEEVATSLSFYELNEAMKKRKQRNRPPLPNDANEAACLFESRNEGLGRYMEFFNSVDRVDNEIC